MNRAFDTRNTPLRENARKARKVPDYLSLFDDHEDSPGTSFASFAFSRSNQNEDENRTNKGPKGTSLASLAFLAPAQEKSAIMAAIFEPGGPGFIVLEFPDFGRMVWTCRDATLVPDQFSTLPRYSWPELERILDSGISRESLAELHRIKTALPGVVRTVTSEQEHPCIDCGQNVDEGLLFCDPCFKKRTVIPIDELVRRREARRQRTMARLASHPCSGCGSTRWRVNARGDAWCLACFERGHEVQP